MEDKEERERGGSNREKVIQIDNRKTRREGKQALIKGGKGGGKDHIS